VLKFINSGKARQNFKKSTTLDQFGIGMGQYVFDHFITKTIKKRLAFKSVKKWAIFFINSVAFLKYMSFTLKS